MRMIFHVGLPKTGTTAIQACLDQRPEQLLQAGFWLPGRREQMADACAKSGNGFELFLKVNSGEPGRSAWDDGIETYFRTVEEEAKAAGCDQILFSSESFSTLTRERWESFATVLKKRDSECLFVLFEREPYSWCFSSWLQQVRRCGVTGWLGFHLRSPANVHHSVYPLATRHILEGLFGHRHQVRAFCFEDHKRDLLATFLSAIGYQGADDWPRQRINPAMTAEEFFLFYHLNKLSKGNLELSVAMLDWLAQNPIATRTKFFFCDPAVQASIYAYLDERGVSYHRREYLDAPNLTEEEFLARFSDLERLTVAFFSRVSDYFFGYQRRIARLIENKLRMHATSPFRAEVPTAFDPVWYLLLHNDVLLHDVDPYRHYAQHGQKEGRRAWIDVSAS